VGKEKQNRRKAKGVWERGTEDKGDDDYDDNDGTTGYDKFSSLHPSVNFSRR